MFDQRIFNSTIDSITRAFTQPVSLANIKVGAILANTPMSSRDDPCILKLARLAALSFFLLFCRL
jgi:hypothetical protein